MLRLPSRPFGCRESHVTVIRQLILPVCIQVLHEHGYSVHPHALREAAKRGDLPMVVWLANAVPAGGAAREHQDQQQQHQQQQHTSRHTHQQLLLLCAEVFSAAARSGSWPLMQWLRSRGCAWGPNVAASAAAAGCGEQLEWLAAEGCPLGVRGAACPYRWRPNDKHNVQ